MSGLNAGEQFPQRCFRSGESEPDRLGQVGVGRHRSTDLVKGENGVGGHDRPPGAIGCAVETLDENHVAPCDAVDSAGANRLHHPETDRSAETAETIR